MGNAVKGDRMRTRTVSFSLVVLMVLGTGCASMQQASEPPTVDVTGIWRGTFSAAQTWSVMATLKQTGAKLEGEYTVFGYAAANGPVTGWVSGNYVSFATAAGYGGDFTARGDEMVGKNQFGAALRLHRQP